MVFIYLRSNGNDVEYVNTKNGYETDFFVRNKIGGNVQLIQVCWDISDKATFERELRGLKSAMAEFNINSGTIVTWDDQAVLNDTINIIPVWQFRNYPFRKLKPSIAGELHSQLFPLP